MPATRTHNYPSLRTSPFPTPSPPSQRNNNEQQQQHADDDMIPFTPVAGPSNPNPTSFHHQTPQHKPIPKLRPHKNSPVPRPHVQEIIEISSDDDDTPPLPSSHASIIANLRRELGKSREDTAKCKHYLENGVKQIRSLQEELKKLKALNENDGSKVVLNKDAVTEHFECPICSSEMWTPYTLPGCGHTFCEKCLVDWFGTVQAKFIAAHPNYHTSHNTNYPLSQLLNYLATYPNLATDPQSIAALKHSLPAEPRYECPECRSQVTSPPIEAFAMKKLIRMVAASTGRSSPKPKSKKAVTRRNPWEGFFPPQKIQ